MVNLNVCQFDELNESSKNDLLDNDENDSQTKKCETESNKNTLNEKKTNESNWKIYQEYIKNISSVNVSLYEQPRKCQLIYS